VRSATARRRGHQRPGARGPRARRGARGARCTEAGALTRDRRALRITRIYLLAAALSARGEQHPKWAWDLNMKGLLNVLELARTAQAGAGVLAQLDRRLRALDAAGRTRRKRP
jgi:nucleoside-diphosphate-sugar epimerase